ncbi:alpha/beta fold hydrolase [Nioella nitratireducens]|uniref:hypothetical protein n=1 Tax=Nioella nitratireducens TaxID=1287720 RepID=UPI0011BA9616|nr:hypothetical protein [Nioella nitratireducens]
MSDPYPASVDLADPPPVEPAAPLPPVPAPATLRRRVLRGAILLFPGATARVLARRYLRTEAAIDRTRLAATPGVTLTQLDDGAALLHYPAKAPDRPHPRILLAHGHDGHPRQFARVLQSLRAKGAAVDLLVLPGHRDPAPEVCGVNRIFKAMQTALDSFGPYDAAATHCVTGNALLQSLDSGRTVGRVALVSAALDLPYLIRTSGRLYGLTGRALDRFVAHVARMSAPCPLEIPWREMASRRSEPVMIVHAAGDWAAPVENAETLASVWPGADLRVYDRGDHNTILSVTPAIATLAQFLTATPL